MTGMNMNSQLMEGLIRIAISFFFSGTQEIIFHDRTKLVDGHIAFAPL
ncbi:MAG: hypothetical protein WB402_07190 [Sulfuricaulis sp.]